MNIQPSFDSKNQTQELTEKQIIQSIINGKKEDFEILVNEYYQQILAYLLRILNYNQHDAHDVLQETFTNAFVNLVTYNSNLQFSSWLYRIAHNLSVDLIRKKSKYYTIDTSDSITQNQIHSNQIVIEKQQTQHQNSIDKQRLESVLSRLDIETRNILTLFYLQGLNLNQISDIFKTSSNTIAARLKRAREKAQRIIKKYNL
jgi:RNA polymerase sigma-70 factor, ECF subfamily